MQPAYNIKKTFSNRAFSQQKGEDNGGSSTMRKDSNNTLPIHSQLHFLPPIDSFDIDHDDNNGKGHHQQGQRWFYMIPNTFRTSLYQRRKWLLLVLPSILFLIVLHQCLVYLTTPPPIPLGDLPTVDFVVGGFPKCGTTSLLFALHRHPDILIPSRESCALKDTWRKTFRVRQRYMNEVQELANGLSSSKHNNHTTDKKIVTGIKCPTAIASANMITRLNEINQHHHFTDDRDHPIKWVIGIRHPVLQVQSFYNYRITELYDKKVWWKDIRRLEDIIFSPSQTPWKDMSSQSHKFHLQLQNLMELERSRTMASHPQEHTATIFLYTVDQIQDEDDDRALSFRQDLSRFLGLSEQIAPFGKENVNRFVLGPQKHKEIIDICQPEFDRVRGQLMRDSVEVANWIQQNIPSSTLITLSNPDFVFENLERWKTDPCDKKGQL